MLEIVSTFKNVVASTNNTLGDSYGINSEPKTITRGTWHTFNYRYYIKGGFRVDLYKISYSRLGPII